MSSSNRWVARIEHAGRQKHLGTFPSQEAAAKAYDKALLRILKKKGNIDQPNRFNFPNLIPQYKMMVMNVKEPLFPPLPPKPKAAPVARSLPMEPWIPPHSLKFP